VKTDSRRSAFTNRRARDTEVRGPNASRGIPALSRKKRPEPRLDSADSVATSLFGARAVDSSPSHSPQGECDAVNAIEEKRRLDLGRVTHAPGLVPVRRFVLQKSSGRLRAQRSGPSAAFGSKARTLARMNVNGSSVLMLLTHRRAASRRQRRVAQAGRSRRR